MLTSIAVLFFIAVEAPVTTGAAIFALTLPDGFNEAMLPPRLLSAYQQSTAEGGDGMVAAIADYWAQLYALVILILGVAEFCMFMTRNQLGTKKALLWAMVLGDIVHIYVFCSWWLADAAGTNPSSFQQVVQGWEAREWTAFYTNVPMIAGFLVLRLVYILTAKEAAAHKDKLS